MTIAPSLITLDLILNQLPLAYFLFEIFLKTSLFILIGIVAAFFYRTHSASNISLVWLIVITASLAVPVFSLVMPGIPLEVEIVQSELEATGVIFNTSNELLLSPWQSIAAKVVTAGTFVYLVGVLLMGSYLVAGIVRLLLLTYRAELIESRQVNQILDQLKMINGSSTKIALKSSPLVSTPLTWGIRNHTILLPQFALKWDSGLLHQAISHELGHIQRNDWFYHVLTKIFLCLYWPIPLAWFAAKVLKIETEKACDDAAVDCTGSDINYANNLLAVACGIKEKDLKSAVGMSSKPSILMLRIQHILSGEKKRNFLRSDEIFIAIAFVLILVAPFSALHFNTSYVETAQPLISKLPRESVKNLPPLQGVQITRPAVQKPEHLRQNYVAKNSFVGAAKRHPQLAAHSRNNTHEILGLEFTLQPAVFFKDWESTPLYMPNPRYPTRAIKKGIEGHVVAEFKIDKNGTVYDTKIIESVPTGTFDKSVLAAVNEFIYCPEVVKGIGGNNQSVRKRFSFSLTESI
jgi:TonB family protein